MSVYFICGSVLITLEIYGGILFFTFEKVKVSKKGGICGTTREYERVWDWVLHCVVRHSSTTHASNSIQCNHSV